MTRPRKDIPGSDRPNPPGRPLSVANSQERIEVSIYLKAQVSNANSRADLRASRSEVLLPHISAIVQFAREHGLDVVSKEPARRLVKLAGPIDKLERAFGTQLHVMEHNGRRFRGRRGTLSLPEELVDSIEAVLGLDTRPAATSKIAFPRVPQAAIAHLPNEVAALYGFPKTNGQGAGEYIGLIELGGGYNDSDNNTAFTAMKLRAPTVIAVPVSGGSNNPGGTDGADGEVALDIQVAGGAAPGARIAVYFAPNTDKGFVDAITAAIHDEVNKPSCISISWGSAEAQWTQQAVASMNSAFADAAALAVTVCAASGDGLATDGLNDGAAHTDFPASSPYVLGCGGTKINSAGGKLTGEVVWNSDGGGSGGGVSTLFAVPAYQKNADIPVSVSTSMQGRGVPDVSADADPNSGYTVVVGGQSQTIGGTSASAPLWAGLVAAIKRGFRKAHRATA